MLGDFVGDNTETCSGGGFTPCCIDRFVPADPTHDQTGRVCVRAASSKLGVETIKPAVGEEKGWCACVCECMRAHTSSVCTTCVCACM